MEKGKADEYEHSRYRGKWRYGICNLPEIGSFRIHRVRSAPPRTRWIVLLPVPESRHNRQLPVGAAFKCIKEEAESLTAILHFSGVYGLNSLVEIPEDEFVRIFDSNLFGVYRINRFFLPLLEPKGRIIITTSELAPLDPLPFTGMYGITKTALESYAYALRMELQLLGYRVYQ